MSEFVHIAVDAMGGDVGPAVTVEGCAISAIRHPNARFLLFGDAEKIQPQLDRHKGLSAVSEIHHTPDSIPMDAKPSQAVRQGRKSSMAMAITSVKVKRAAAVVSAGSTGALMAISKVRLRTFPGVARPAIAAVWPTQKGQTLVLDMGANVDADIKQLVDFAILGEAFAHVVLNRSRPSVGLLNVGSEDVKGNDVVKAVDELLRASDLPMEYVGYIEGDDIAAGTVDVVVTDGFTGNIALKTAEGIAKMFTAEIRSALTSSWMAKLGALLASGGLRKMKERLDPRSANGGVFLGLNGLVIKSHGGTDGHGFAAALDNAIELADSDFGAHITDALALVKDKVDAADDALKAAKKKKSEETVTP